MERHNRKSHLAPKLSPSAQALLRGDPSTGSTVSPTKENVNPDKTPTSGEIPIADDHHNPEQPAVQRVLSAQVNGSNGMLPKQSPLERPVYPPRTSSTSVLALGRPKEQAESTSIPRRPAPPPSGPLPQPPGASARLSRRQGMAAPSSYPNGDGQSL